MELLEFYRLFISSDSKTRNEMLEELKSLEIKKPFNWVSEIFEKLFAESSKDAIVYINESTDSERKISYRELYESYNRFINFLRQMDIKKGSNIYIMAGAVPEQ